MNKNLNKHLNLIQFLITSFFFYIFVSILFVFLLFAILSKSLFNLVVSNGNFDFNSWFNGDGSDLLNDFTWGVKIDESLVNSHFVTIPGLRTFTTWSLSGGNTKNLGWETDWTLNLKLRFLGTGNKVRANLFKRLNISGS